MQSDHLNAGVAQDRYALSVGYEVLGSDNGVGFYTPLATLAKFNGWADAFLAACEAILPMLVFRNDHHAD